MPILMPTPVLDDSPPCIHVPEFGNKCQSLHSSAMPTINFKTAAFDRSATPPSLMMRRPAPESLLLMFHVDAHVRFDPGEYR